MSRGYYSPRQIEAAIRYVFGVDSQLIGDGTYYVAVEDDLGTYYRRQRVRGFRTSQ